MCIRDRLLMLLGLAAAAGRSLPNGSLIVGYGTSCGDTSKMIQEAELGVNVIIWFASNLIADRANRATVQSGVNHTCVANVAKYLKDQGLETTHLISIGGWDAPHPNTSWSGSEWAETWINWNRHCLLYTSPSPRDS
eukprot:TRINITY_DN8916_c0_g1_i3.p1 TRINITY_DN8916_c0_g1~~TRINITY_DN8916_c0_g1_i3.p1  ORF type:complete len:137 (+),score=26.58 TRINITY_DN8916_c0_g1_i3:174-584(+)